MAKRIITYSPQTIREKNFKTYPFTGDWEKLIGQPDVRFSSIIHGVAKSGKSTFCLKFAQYCSQWGKVLYVASEELISMSLQQRLETYNIVSPKIRFVGIRSVEGLEHLARNARPRFIIVDSAQILGLGFKDFKRLKETFKRMYRSWHIVLQSKANGDFKGGTEWVHETDVKIKVENGIATAQGRFNGEGRMQVFKRNQIQQQLF